MKTSIGLVCLLALASVSAWSNSSQHQHAPTPYAGYQAREIKSLSQQDIDDIQNGRGWGLALPAELSGLPGPVHLLELKAPLALSAEQIERIQGIYHEMRDEAIEAGERFIQAERALSEAFANKDLEPAHLATLVDRAAKARAELRYTHLSRHLMTPELLTPEQIQHYAKLRGYTDDPCRQVPEGHDAHMWRQHNNCL